MRHWPLFIISERHCYQLFCRLVYEVLSSHPHQKGTVFSYCIAWFIRYLLVAYIRMKLYSVILSFGSIGNDLSAQPNGTVFSYCIVWFINYLYYQNGTVFSYCIVWLVMYWRISWCIDVFLTLLPFIHGVLYRRVTLIPNNNLRRLYL